MNWCKPWCRALASNTAKTVAYYLFLPEDLTAFTVIALCGEKSCPARRSVPTGRQKKKSPQTRYSWSIAGPTSDCPFSNGFFTGSFQNISASFEASALNSDKKAAPPVFIRSTGGAYIGCCCKKEGRTAAPAYFIMRHSNTTQGDSIWSFFGGVGREYRECSVLLPWQSTHRAIPNFPQAMPPN